MRASQVILDTLQHSNPMCDISRGRGRGRSKTRGRGRMMGRAPGGASIGVKRERSVDWVVSDDEVQTPHCSMLSFPVGATTAAFPVPVLSS